MKCSMAESHSATILVYLNIMGVYAKVLDQMTQKHTGTISLHAAKMLHMLPANK